MRTLIKLSLVILVAVIVPSGTLRAQSILRDAETERFLYDLTNPLFEAAGIERNSVKIGLIYSKSINAFVAGGQHMFVHSGLFTAADNLGELQGVLAHETGHIAGGHYSRTKDAYESAGMISILSMVLGAAAIAAGGGDAGIGMIMAGQSVAQGNVLAYSRTQEAVTDQAGASYMEAIGVSGLGLISFFEKLRNQEILAQVRQDPYVRSHPLNRQRILALQKVVHASPYVNTPLDPRLSETFNRLKAKLRGYLDHPTVTLRNFPLSDTSISARYARVYAYHKALEWDLALLEADALIAAEPNNPYFHEIKGQILFENGRVDDSIDVFQGAVRLAPHEPLILTAFGQALVSQEDRAKMARAMPVLKQATRLDRSNTFAWFNLAKAYSWLDMQAEASLATAERYYSGGNASQALMHSQRAMANFNTGSPEWLRAQDIAILARAAVDKQKKRSSRRRVSDTPHSLNIMKIQ